MSFVETYQWGRESLLNLLRGARGFVEPAKGSISKGPRATAVDHCKVFTFHILNILFDKDIFQIMKLRSHTHIYLRRVCIGRIHDQHFSK